MHCANLLVLLVLSHSLPQCNSNRLRILTLHHSLIRPPLFIYLRFAVCDFKGKRTSLSNDVT